MKLLKKVPSALAGLLVVLLVLLAYGTLPNRFYRVVAIEGNSMSPTLRFGDLVVITPPPKTMAEIPPNSVVVMSVNGSLVTHRLIGFDTGGRPITKGDANQVTDNFAGQNLAIVGIEQMRIPYIGYALFWVRSLVRT